MKTYSNAISEQILCDDFYTLFSLCTEGIVDSL